MLSLLDSRRWLGGRGTRKLLGREEIVTSAREIAVLAFHDVVLAPDLKDQVRARAFVAWLFWYPRFWKIRAYQRMLHEQALEPTSCRSWVCTSPGGGVSRSYFGRECRDSK